MTVLAHALVLAALALSPAAAQPREAGAPEFQQSAPVLVAAAASLRFALPDIAAAYERQNGGDVRLSFGSSGNLMRQIEQGAPFEIFLSADESYVLRLVEGGHTRGEGVLYAVGRLVLMLPAGSPLAADGTLADLGRAVADGRLHRFAIANPAHAPYGKRAREVLRHVGLWKAIQPYLLLGENVGQAARFAASGDTEGGLVALSLAKAPALADRVRWAAVPREWHNPLRQRMVLLRGAGAEAERFYAFLQGAAARRLFVRFGFRLSAGES